MGTDCPQDQRSCCRKPSKPLKKDGIFGVPYERNPAFTGRSQLLETLRAKLVGDSAAAVSQVEAISGLGGIGKTQTAVEYAYRYRKSYSAVLWVTAETEQTLSTGFSTIAQLLQLPEKDNPEQDQVRKGVLRWLEWQERWLVVFDNADRPELLKRYLPRQHRGHILITSRARVFESAGLFVQAVTLEKLSPEEARSFFIRRTQRESMEEVELRAADTLAQELDYLPLALEQAAAYMVQRATRFQDYLLSFRKRSLGCRWELLGSVATIWVLNFSEVEQTPASADLLRLSGFLAPEDIPLDLLAAGVAKLDGSLAQAIAGFEEDPLVLDEILEPLMRYSLVQRRPGGLPVYSMHRLTQAVIRDNLGPQAEQHWAERAVLAVSWIFPSPDVSAWPVCRRLISHAQICAEWLRKSDMQSERAAFLLTVAGSYLQQRAQYAEAEPLLVRALDIRNKVLGPEHPETANSLHNLGLLYSNRGKYAEAEPLYQRSLVIRPQALGPEHPDVAQSLHNLGTLYRYGGEYAKAEALYQRSLAIRKKALGPEHPDVAQTLNDLALLYRYEAKYAEAEPLYQHSLAMYEKALGPHHPDVASSLNNLATLYRYRGEYAKAEPLYQRSLAIGEKALGPEHPDVATSLNNLAVLYYDQGEYARAEPLHQRSLVIREKALGPEHPDVATSLNHLATLYRHRGKYAEAEPLYQRSLAIREKALGPEHPDVATSLNDLALLDDDEGKYADAELLLLHSLAIREQALGPEHPDVGLTLNSLAELYRIQGEYSAAEPLYRRALAIDEQALGANHPDAATDLNNLALLFEDKGDYAAAEPLYRRALAIDEQALGPDHPSKKAIERNLKSLLRKISKASQRN